MPESVKTKEELERENAQLQNELLKLQLAEAQRNANAPKPKKRSGCLWTTVKLGGGAVALLCILGSCINSCINEEKPKQQYFSDYTPTPMTPPAQSSAQHKLTETLAQSEEWRADFKEQIAKYDVKSQEGLEQAVTYVSLVGQAFVVMSQKDSAMAVKLNEEVKAMNAKLQKEHPTILNMIRPITTGLFLDYKKAREENQKYTFSEEDSRKKVLEVFDKHYTNEAAMRAAMSQEKDK